MSHPLRLCFLALAWACSASALVYALLRYGLQPADEFSAYNHPAQPLALATHVGSSFALSFVLGVVFHAHVLPRLSGDGRGRRSGLLLCALAAAMVASGALLPCASHPELRQLLFLAHAISGSGFALGLPWHILVARRAAARAATSPHLHVSVDRCSVRAAARIRGCEPSSLSEAPLQGPSVSRPRYGRSSTDR